jgi:hypothetical protein
MFQFSGLSTLSHGLQPCGFPHSDIYGFNGRLHLPVAFRSLPRPSSSSRAKASPMRPYYASISLRLKYPIRSLLAHFYLAFLPLVVYYFTSSFQSCQRSFPLYSSEWGVAYSLCDLHIYKNLPLSTAFCQQFRTRTELFYNPLWILPLFFFLGFYF